jgi:hypothetical protein
MPHLAKKNHGSSRHGGAADAICMERPSFLIRRTGALAIVALAASDVVYRLLLRESVRRALGMGD